MEINWEDLKDGHRSFEDLANEYVKAKWTDIDWHPTKKTRDGNRDGEALIYVFQGNKKEETHWWMEAKYSLKRTRLSRYRMDPTIVSALIDGKVKRVIFVSNTEISAKDMNDIRIALINGIRCNEVTFCSRLELEYWISLNPNVYRTYFKQTIPFEKISVPELFVVEGLTFYDILGEHVFFKEPLKRILIGHKYTAFCKIFCRDETIIDIRKPRTIRGLTIRGNKSLELKPGENSVSINIYIKSNFHSENGLIYLVIQGHNIKIDSTLSVSNSIAGMEELILKTQQQIIKDIFSDFKRAQKTNESFYCCITGETGVGKTYIINQLTEKFSFEHRDVFFYLLSDNRKYNYRILIYLTFFFLFPYLPYHSIDVEYLEKLSRIVSYVDPVLIQMVRNMENIDDANIKDVDIFSKAMQAPITGNHILPDSMSINNRIIILEDVHKLDELGLEYLLELMYEIRQRNLPVFLLFSSHPYIKQRRIYQKYNTKYPVHEYKCELSFEDVYGCARHFKYFEANEDYLKAFKSNVFELFTFIRYLYQEDFTDLKDFLTNYNLFLQSSMLEKSILDMFTSFFRSTPESKEYCARCQGRDSRTCGL